MTIKEMLDAANLTTTQASEFLRISRRTIDDWRKGVRNPPAYVLRSIEAELSPLILSHLEAKWSYKTKFGPTVRMAGFDLVDAIERNFSSITETYKEDLGSPSGYHIHAASVQYDDTIFDGTGGCVLTLITYPLPPIDNNDNKEKNLSDQRTTKIWITATRDEIPEPYAIPVEKAPKPSLEAMTDDSLDRQVGYAIAIINTLSKYTVLDCVEPAMYIELRYNVRVDTDPTSFLEKCENMVLRSRPRDIKQIAPLWETFRQICKNVEDGKDLLSKENKDKFNNNCLRAYASGYTMLRELNF